MGVDVLDLREIGNKRALGIKIGPSSASLDLFRRTLAGRLAAVFVDLIPQGDILMRTFGVACVCVICVENNFEGLHFLTSSFQRVARTQ